jgi:hypothetical protein
VLDDKLAVAANLGGPVEYGLQVQGRAVTAAVAFDAEDGLLGGLVRLQPLARRFNF